jgi:RNA polymerase sigma-70 factor (ECF subfamily)
MQFSEEKEWQDLAAKAQSGDKPSYNQLLHSVLPYIQNFLRASLANPDWVDDVTQEVLLSVHRSLHTYSADRPFKPWLTSIISFRRTDFLRKHYGDRKHKQTSTDDAEFIADHVTNPSNAGELKDIESALNDLPEKQRAIFTMIKLEGYTAKEVANTMGMSESAVKVSAHRTSVKLKGILE